MLGWFGKQLARPTQSLSGWLTTRFFKFHNHLLEENSVKLCDLQPDETVLEIGHGPGLGLQHAIQKLTGPQGRLLGVDYSEYMHLMASELMKEQISAGKVKLFLSDVAKMPIEDNSVDKVFHCNCYYFWPDLKRGAAEIHRVMKPGGLMVTTLRLDRVILFASKKIMTAENWRPKDYMEALESARFINVRMENRKPSELQLQCQLTVNHTDITLNTEPFTLRGHPQTHKPHPLYADRTRPDM
ncbi:demethylmenaquinone methyltransferase-like [Colossoma macropomum]|uniref:demethylmenaquinone methyltransferase-like n=1 Tax=Colossoma macropomum TaxID=42526 RepID=UPI00186515B2|nr:demethylmenaquinone methyltransferase-like [Colossoma macropomum]XP_036447406.1 demethylmenaquinone methyltransferase-like [Colossoma macropomum]